MFSTIGEKKGESVLTTPGDLVSPASSAPSLDGHSDADFVESLDEKPSRSGELAPVLLARFPATSGSISYHGNDGRILLLDSAARVIYAADGDRVSTFADDRPRALLQISDFAIPGPDLLALADNSRQALYLFEKGRFRKGVRDLDGRALFRHIQYLWADAQSGRIGVYDSGRNRTLVFATDGTLLTEVSEKYEPVFWNGLLVRLEKQETSLIVFGLDIGQAAKPVERRLFTIATTGGRMLLDAWGAGTAGPRLVLVTYEARDDEDHPDGGRVLLLGEGGSETRPIRMNLDLELVLRRPFATVRRDGADWLIEALPTETGPAIYGFRLP